ncbi:glycoside hydrolase family 5 protein [Paracidovorax avenae]|uniref:glycoside hydrolase family 5 protein n=2 Tax=Paracidovorax avenae TaxID=80867 RepID=UPI001864EE65|nr:cellulase family glycosylhydrolase [Paracidovorax avenae]
MAIPPRRASRQAPSASSAADMPRRSVLQGGLGAAAWAATAGWSAGHAATASLPLAGMNLSGLGSNSFVENAQIGTHYRDISDKHIAAAGDCPLFRLPTTAQRFSTGQGLPLNATYVKEVSDVLDRLAAQGKRAILELHDYMRLPMRVAALQGYRIQGGQLVGPDGRAVPDPAAPSVWNGTYAKGNFEYVAYFDGRDQLLKLYEYRVIGTQGCKLYTEDGLPDLWLRLVQRFRDHPAIFGWGLMNEPYTGKETNANGSALDMRALWQRTATRTAARIFDYDRKHFVFICGNEFATAREWVKYSNDLATIPDPYGLIVYEAHNYLDSNGQGGGAWKNPQETVAPDTGEKMVANFLQWLQDNGKRGFLGEHGYPENNASAEVATRRMLQLLQRSNVPSTQWCFGPGWPDGDPLGMSRDTGTDTIAVKGNIAAVQPFFKERLATYLPPLRSN